LATELRLFRENLDRLPADQAKAITDYLINRLPEGHLDQAIAATRHTQDIARRTAQIAGNPEPRLVDRLDVDWLHDSIDLLLASWFTGRARTCMHQLDHRHPQPVFSAAWAPDLIVCGDCVHLLRIADPIKDATCDRCGYVTTGLANNDGIHGDAVTYLSLTYQFGLCRDCHATYVGAI
jgi:hypothetical protein